MTAASSEETFLELSRVLTGETTLDPRLGASYWHRLDDTEAATFAGYRLEDLQETLIVFREIETSGKDPVPQVEERIMGDVRLKVVARAMIHLWLTSALASPDGELRFGEPEAFASGLVWRFIGSHPPAVAGGTVGYWRYPPAH